jgi:hypothetical protein
MKVRLRKGAKNAIFGKILSFFVSLCEWLKQKNPIFNSNLSKIISVAWHARGQRFDPA